MDVGTIIISRVLVIVFFGVIIKLVGIVLKEVMLWVGCTIGTRIRKAMDKRRGERL